jgi:hypothetical protein
MELNRFDLEKAMMACRSTQDDLRLIFEEATELDCPREEILNALMGLGKIHEMRSEKMFRIFEELVGAGEIS